MAAVLRSVSNDFPALHSILDTAVFIVSGWLAFLLWNVGWRAGQNLRRFEAVYFATVAILELLHVITALDFAEAPDATVLLLILFSEPASCAITSRSPLTRRNCTTLSSRLTTTCRRARAQSCSRRGCARGQL
jgi:hypothetical protein